MNLTIEKSSNLNIWIFILSLPNTFCLKCFSYPSPEFRRSKKICGSGNIVAVYSPTWHTRIVDQLQLV